MAANRSWRPQIVRRSDAVRIAEQNYHEHLSACRQCVVRQPMEGVTIVEPCRIGAIYANSVRTAFRWAHK